MTTEPTMTKSAETACSPPWVFDELPPEGITVECRTRSHGDCDGVRHGEAIHVGLPQSWNPVVVAWRLRESGT